MGYRDDRDALKEKVDELMRELAAAQERNQQDARTLAELAENVRTVAASVNNGNPPPAAVPVAPAPKSNAAMMLVLFAAGLAVVAGGIAFTVVRASARRPVPVLPVPIATTTLPPAASAPHADGLLQVGALQTLGLDRPGRLVGSSATTLFTMDAATLEVAWSARVADEIDWGGSGQVIAIGDRLALVTGKGAFFHGREDGALISRFLWKTETMPNGACSPGKDQLLVKTPFDGTVRLDATTGTKAATGPSCSPDRERLHCGAGEECGYQEYKTPVLDCAAYLRYGREMVMPCDTDDGTRRHMLIMLGQDRKVRWTVERSKTSDAQPEYLDVVDDVLILAGSSMVEGYSPKTGELLWQHAHSGAASSTILGGEKHVVFGYADTVISVSAATGSEVARLHVAR